MRARLAVLVTALLTIGGFVAVNAPPSAALVRLSLVTTENRVLGQSYGPNYWTAYGEGTVIGFRWNGLYGSASRTSATLSITNHNPALSPLAAPAKRTVRITRSGASTTMVDAATGQALPTTALSSTWWNPLSWDWGHIFNSIFNGLWTIWQNCLKGVVGAGLTTAGTGLVLRGVMDKAMLYAGTDGLAVLVVGSCFASVLG